MGGTLTSTGMWQGEVFAISDCLVNLAKQCYCSELVVGLYVGLCVFLCVLGDVIHGYMEVEWVMTT